MQNIPKSSFKEELVHLREEFFACAANYHSKAVPLKVFFYFYVSAISSHASKVLPCPPHLALLPSQPQP